MTTQTETRTRALELARDLLDGADVHYRGFDAAPRTSVDVGDGRTATLRVIFDEDSGIGRWIGEGRNGSDRHHDDCFGTFAWRGRDSCYGYPSQRPAGFDGRAVVLDYTGARTARIDGAAWWQPTDDDTDPAATLKAVRDYLDGDWFHVGLVVELAGESAALWGVDWHGDDSTYPAEVVADLLDEAGLGVDPFDPAVAGESSAMSALLTYLHAVGADELACTVAARGFNPAGLRHAAAAWRAYAYGPPAFAYRLETLAAAIAATNTNGVAR